MAMVAVDRNASWPDLDFLRLNGRWEGKNKSGTT